jgi:hypothetical protein
MAILKINYVQRHGKTKGTGKAWSGGKLASTRAGMRAANYYRFRDGDERDQQQRSWRDKDGNEISHADVLKAIEENAVQHDYLYRCIVSTKDAALTPDDYRTVLDGHFTAYYVIEHHNTDHPHAHVIGLRDRVIKDDERKEIYNTIKDREREREQERARGIEHEPRGTELTTFDNALAAATMYERAGIEGELKHLADLINMPESEPDRDFYAELDEIRNTPYADRTSRHAETMQATSMGDGLVASLHQHRRELQSEIASGYAIASLSIGGMITSEIVNQVKGELMPVAAPQLSVSTEQDFDTLLDEVSTSYYAERAAQQRQRDQQSVIERAPMQEIHQNQQQRQREISADEPELRRPERDLDLGY